MTTDPSEGGNAGETRARYLVPLFVLVIMLASTFGAAWVLGLSIVPAVDAHIHGVTIAEFLIAGVLICVVVFLTLLRFANSREGYFRRILDLEQRLQRSNEELSVQNVQLEGASAEKTAEIQSKILELERSRTAMVSLLEDLTESRDRIEEARAFNAAVLASIADGVIVLDQHGDVTLVNAAMMRMAGITGPPDALYGKNRSDVIKLLDPHDQPVPADLGPISKVLKAGANAKPQRESTYRMVRRDGVMVDIDYEASPVVRGGILVAVVVLVRDITEQRRVDRAKSEFVSLASHQLRTPLTAIGWFIELLMSETSGKLTEQERDYLGEISRANRRMIDLIDSLLNVSRIEMGRISIQPQPMDLEVYLRETLAFFTPLIEKKRISVQIDIAPDLPYYEADPKILAIIMQNLLSNAFKYTSEGGAVTIALKQENGGMLLSVADSGIGIAEEAKKHMFEKLFRADNAKAMEAEGSGLGLYLVKSIMDQIGGQIMFTTAVDVGTTFTVWLPSGGMKQQEGTNPITTPFGTSSQQA